MPRVDIAWAAGFLEGEGCFMKRKNPLHSMSPRISAVQKQREPLDRLVKLFGGKVSKEWQKRERTYGEGSIWRWTVYGPRAVGIMMTIFTWMSPRRRQRIKSVIDVWNTRPGKGWWNPHPNQYMEKICDD